MSDILDPLAWVAKAGLPEDAVLVRYPGEEPTLEEAREALDIARAVRRFARRFLGVK